MTKIETINGEKVNLEELKNYSNWRWRSSRGEMVTLLSKDNKEIVTIGITRLIAAWIREEEQTYIEATKD